MLPPLGIQSMFVEQARLLYERLPESFQIAIFTAALVFMVIPPYAVITGESTLPVALAAAGLVSAGTTLMHLGVGAAKVASQFLRGSLLGVNP